MTNAANESTTQQPVESKIVAYKGFHPDWTCTPKRGVSQQYAVGQTYTHDGPLKLCHSGYHACEYPLDIFGYYPPTGQMAKVELADVADTIDTDSKRVGRSITIQASLTISALISAAIEVTKKRCKPANAKHSDGNQSASSTTGYQSASSTNGEQAVAAALGYDSCAMAGKSGTIIVAWWDKAASRKRVTVGYIGEDGIQADTWYRCDDAGRLVPA